MHGSALAGVVTSVLMVLGGHGAGAAEDIVLFDFESGMFEGWRYEGEKQAEVFGLEPLQPQSLGGRDHRKYLGYQGQYVVRTGDTRHDSHPNGKLISKPFTLDRDYVRFQLGGEVNPFVKVWLEVDGQEVRTAYGNNSYDLKDRSWEVKDLKGRTACFVIQDAANMPSLIRVDFIRLSDQPAAPLDGFDERWQETSWVRPGEWKLAIFHEGHYFDRNTITRGHDGRFHLYTCKIALVDRWKPKEGQIFHYVADHVYTGPWQGGEIVIEKDPGAGEDLVQDPHVVFQDGTYYLYYIGAGKPWRGWEARPWTQGPYHLYLATSKDGTHFTRHEKNPLFSDQPFLETPYAKNFGDTWVMYYGGTDPQSAVAPHGILYRTSTDLVHWSERRVACLDPKAAGWPEHLWFRNPIVIERGVWQDKVFDYYLLTGPVNNDNQSRFHFSGVYRSKSPFHWDPTTDAEFTEDKLQPKGVFFDGHGGIVRDGGRDHITHCNEYAEGIWIAPLAWKTPDSRETSK